MAPPDRSAERPVPVEVQARSATDGIGKPVFVGAVTIAGLEVLSPADFSDIFAEHVGRSLSQEELSALANAVASRMRARGYAFASAWIEPQRVANGVLAVSAAEGRIDELRFDGDVPPSVRRALEPLVNGRPARLPEVERHLLIAGDIDGVRISGTRFLRESGRGVLLVQVRRYPVSAYAWLSNQGTKPIGPEQARLELKFNGVLASDDQLILAYATTPAEPRELQFGFAKYAKRINARGTELAVVASGSVTHPGAYLESLQIKNRSWYAGVEALEPLLRRRKASLWLQGEFGVRNLTQWRRGDRIRRDQLAVARLTVYGYRDVAGGRLRASTTLSRGLGILSATEPGDPLASRSDGDGTFTSVALWADWTRDLDEHFSLRLAARGQLSSQPLLISEEASLGGTVFLRGYDWGERTGDEGVMGSAELRYSWKDAFGAFKRAQLYAFVDGGTVSNPDSGFGGGSLASAGGGLRLDITTHLGAHLELAAPLTGARYDTGDRTPKLSFGLVRRFR